MRCVYLADDIENDKPEEKEIEVAKRTLLYEKLQLCQTKIAIFAPIKKCEQASATKDPDNFSCLPYKKAFDAAASAGVKLTFQCLLKYQTRLSILTCPDQLNPMHCF